MSPNISLRPALPEGWYYPKAADAQSLLSEFRRELPHGHLLDGIPVEVFAWCDGATDDVLFHHLREPDRFTVIHLTWAGHTEINTQHPTVEFDGNFFDFFAHEEQILQWLRLRAT
jgi:hypothetical protein